MRWRGQPLAWYVGKNRRVKKRAAALAENPKLT